MFCKLHCLSGELAEDHEIITLASVAAHLNEFEAPRCRTSQFAKRFLTANACMWNDFPPSCCVLFWDVE